MCDNRKWIPVSLYAFQKGIAVSTVHHWIKNNKIPFKTLFNNGRKYYLIDEQQPFPVKKTSNPTWLNSGVRSVPVIDLPWMDDQISVDQLIDELAKE